MKKLILIAAIALSACAAPKPIDPYNIDPDDAPGIAKELAKTVVKPLLRDPSSAEFIDLTLLSKTAYRPMTLCGWVSSKNGFGGMSGPQRFVAADTVTLEEAVPTSEMDRVWAESCPMKMRYPA